VTYTVNGASSIPAGTTCTLNSVATTSVSTNSVALVSGANTITLICTNAFGASTPSAITVNRGAVPVVVITAPANPTTTTATSINVTYTVDGGSSIPAGTTCTVNGASSTSTSTNSVALALGLNTIPVSCVNGFGTSAATSVAVTRNNSLPLPVLTISSRAAVSTKSTGTPRAVTFSATNSPTGYSCRSGYGADAGATGVNSATFTACASPWDVTVPAGIPDGTNIHYQIKATNATGDSNIENGYTWLDNRAFAAINLSATPVANSLTTATTANDAGAHPDVVAHLDVAGYDNARNVQVTFPDGAMGSLSSIPVASRCTKSQAALGTCPASSKIGTIAGTGTSQTDGTVAAGGDVFLVDSGQFDGTENVAADGSKYYTTNDGQRYAAGVAVSIKNIMGPITGANLGDINATGYLKTNDSARNLRIEITDLPNQTTLLNKFHLQGGDLTVKGDTGGAANPLLTNPHFCGAYNPNRRPANAPAESPNVTTYANRFYGTGTSWEGNATPFTSTVYSAAAPLDNCAAEPFNPALAMSLSSTAAASSTQLTTTLTVPANNSTMRQAVVRLPSFVAPTLPNFGVAGDQCPLGLPSAGGTLNNVGPSAFGTSALATSYIEFEPANCPAQARVGVATINTPILPQTLTADVWAVNKSPVPNIGISIDPTKYGNPKGVRFGLFGTTSTPQVNLACDPLDGDLWPGGCPTQIVATMTSIPDVPVSSLTLTVGGIAGRSLGANVLEIAQAADVACKNAGENFTSQLVPWSGAATKTPGGLLTPTGCNQ
jgi:hypothetical protein